MRLWHRLSRVVSALVVLLGYGLLEVSWGQTSEPIGSVLAVEGTAEVRAAAATVWEPLQFRAAVLPNDTIRTAVNSKVKVLLRDESIITVAERSEMQFTEFLLTPQQRRTVVSVATGTLRMVAGKLFGSGSTTEVRTPNTVAGVRGTTFVVTFIPPEETEVTTLEGTVDVRNPRVPQLAQTLPANFQTRVLGNGPPELPRALPLDNRQRIERVLRLTEQIPVETTPTGARLAEGPARGERVVTGPVALLTPAVPLPEATSALTTQSAQESLETLVGRTTLARAVLAAEPSGSGPVITPDNLRSTAVVLQTQPTNLRLTITLPR